MTSQAEPSIDVATADDVDIVTGLVRRYFAYDQLEFEDGVARAIGELLSDPSLGRVFLARAGSEVIGYSALTFAFDFEAHGRIGVVTDLFIEEHARGKGHGRSLLDRVCRFAMDHTLNRLEICVIDGNDRAAGLYRSRGFVPVAGRSFLAMVLRS